MVFEHDNFGGRSWPFGLDRSWNYREFHVEPLANAGFQDSISSCTLSPTEGICEAYLFDNDDGHLGGQYVFTVAEGGVPHELASFQGMGFNDRASGILLVNSLPAPFEQRVAIGGVLLNQINSAFRQAPDSGTVRGGGGFLSSGFRIGDAALSWYGCPSHEFPPLVGWGTYAKVTIPITVNVQLLFGLNDEYHCMASVFLLPGMDGNRPTLLVETGRYDIAVESGVFAGEVRSQLRAIVGERLTAVQPLIDTASRQAFGPTPALPGGIRLKSTYLLPGDRTDRMSTQGSGSCDGEVTYVAKFVGS